MLTLIPENVPTELIDYPHWVLWRLEDHDKPKLDKVPYSITDKKADSTKPSTWATYQDVCRVLSQSNGYYNGIGFVLSKHSPFCGGDLDDCVENGKILPWARKIINKIDSYSEISPSETGIRFIVKANKPGDRCKIAYETGKVEIYETGRFLTITGHHISGTPCSVKDRQTELEAIYKEIFPDDRKDLLPPAPVSHVSISDNDLIEKIRRSKEADKFGQLWRGDISGYPSHSEADLALCAILAFWTGNDHARIDALFRQSGLFRQKKWNKRHGRDTYGNLTIEKAISGTTEVYKPGRRENRKAAPRPESKPEKEEEVKTPCEQKPDPLVFPKNVMGGLAGDFARIYAARLESPPHFFFVSFLTCLGSVVADRITLDTEVYPQPRLYTLLLGESADDRKSTAITKTVDFFQDTLVESFDVSFGIGSAEGLQKRFEGIKKRNEDKGYDENPRLLLCFDEFKQFVSKSRIETSVLLPCVTTLFESTRYESQTKHSGILLDKVHLTMLAASTMQTYERVWDASFTDIGFDNRLFLVPGKGEKRFSIPESIPQDEINELKKCLFQILKHASEKKTFVVTPAAKELYHQWYISLESSIHTKRLDTYALRLMVLFALNEGRSEVDEQIVSKVIALVNWQLEVRKMLAPIDADNALAKMEGSIRRALSKGPKRDWELKQATNANRTGLWIYTTARENLQTAGEISWIKSQKIYALAPEP